MHTPLRTIELWALSTFALYTSVSRSFVAILAFLFTVVLFPWGTPVFWASALTDGVPILISFQPKLTVQMALF